MQSGCFLYGVGSKVPKGPRLGDAHDYNKELHVVIPEEGCYEFRLKLYQVENDTTFYSKKYRLDVVKKDFEYDPDAAHHYYYYGNLEKIE